MDRKDFNAAALRAARMFRGADAAALEPLLAAAHGLSLAEGELLWQAGDGADYFTIIARGLVQVERRTASGEAAIVGIFGPSESIGDAAALAGTPYPAAAVAASDRVEIVRVPREVVVATMEREPSLGRALQQALLEHTHALNAKIDIVTAGSVPARLSTLLLHLGERFGDENEAGELMIPIPLSRAALARLVSARTETVIRTLSQWTKSGLVRSTPEGFLVPRSDALRSLAREG